MNGVQKLIRARCLRFCSSLERLRNVPETNIVPQQSKDELPSERLAEGKQVQRQVLSYNLAAYADDSETIQNLVRLGVDLNKVERTPGAQEVILKLDFDRDIKKFIRFLHDSGVPADSLGRFITLNPFIFKEDLENLQIRLNYLESKRFIPVQISRIITQNPSWLSHNTVDIDKRLGFLQQKFLLKSDQVRNLATKLPKLVTFKLNHIETIRFSVLEEMGFTEDNTRDILLQAPKVFMKTRRNLMAQFNQVHNIMKIPHELIVPQAKVLLSREARTRERHLYLESLHRNQYDPTKPNYISLMDIVAHDDINFCNQIAKTPVALYSKFLKTL